ncbi:MAG: VWA domain-containing protein [Sedimentibacter sp.]|uniref:VWA domain-containing protein n=1 Tax=Sedimentibacter sp. TaxID=1960295 RepID=UPI002981D3AF|nr:VWA domain-containing protein [Sedimentibacter sp.]MDW5300399.1 VWA domain-containing protein [Sedimentibacter sp.]
MNNKLFKKTMCFALTLFLLISVFSVNFADAVAGDSEMEPIQYTQGDTVNFPQYPNEGYVRLEKTAEWVEGEENIAKVTMALDGKGMPKKTDVVLVIDRSGSMNEELSLTYEEVPLTFTVNKTINYQSNNKSKKGTWTNRTSSSATISLTAYVDSSGAFKGYKSGAAITVSGLITNAARYRMTSSSSNFISWNSISNDNCANALISIFGGSQAMGTIDGQDITVTFPSSKGTLQNTSGSITTTRIAEAKEAAKKFVASLLATENLRTLNNIAVVSYSSSGYGNGTVYQDSGLSHNNTALNTAIDSIKATGGTHIQAGIKKAQDILEGSTADNKYIVVLSDGEPTFSYRATEAEPTVDEDLALNYSSDIGYKLTEFNSNVLGTGGDYDYDSDEYYYAYSNYENVWVDGYWEPRLVEKYPVTNNGLPTISQALLAKKSGIEIYSVGFAVSGNSDAQYTMEHIASRTDNFYLTTEDLSGVFTDIAGRIAKAGTNSRISGSIIANDEAGYNFTIITGDINHPINAMPGTATVTNNSISWNLGDITETRASLTYYIRFNVTGGNPIPDDAMLDTGGVSSVIYQNHNEKWVEQNFQSTRLSAGGGTVNVSYFLANSSGQPVNSNGEIIPFENRVIIEGSNVIESAALGDIITSADYVRPLKGYVSQSTVALDEDGNAVTAQIPVSRATIYLNFPYYPQPSYNVRYNGNGNTGGEVPVDDGNYYVGNEVTVLDKGTLVRDGFTFMGWSTSSNGEVIYSAGNNFNMPSNGITLYAVWERSQYTLNINYKYKDGEIFDTHIEVLNVNDGYNVSSPEKPGWKIKGGDEIISGNMPEHDVTYTVEYEKIINELIGHSMYPNKGLEAISGTNFTVVAEFDYTFGFSFIAGQDSADFNLSMIGDSDNNFTLNNYKLYEGSTIVSSADTLGNLNKDEIEDGKTYTITYSLKCNKKDVSLGIEVINDFMIVDLGVVPKTINIISIDMPPLE